MVREAAVTTSGGSKRRVLYLYHAAAGGDGDLNQTYQHDSAVMAGPIVKQIGEESGAFQTTATDDCSVLTAENLNNYDAMLFFTSGELPISEERKQALLDFVHGGKGLAGVHSATDTFYRWPAYGELIGGYLDGHPWFQEVRIKVEDRNHPATRHLGEGFTINDEIYQFRNWSRDKVHVLLSLDTDSVSLNNKDIRRADKDFGVTWTRTYGKGRVFYSSLGHHPGVWADELFRTHLLNGLLWVMSAAE